jgi:hypothetical protein
MNLKPNTPVFLHSNTPFCSYASARRCFARLASEIFLNSLQMPFFSNLLVLVQSRGGL